MNERRMSGAWLALLGLALAQPAAGAVWIQFVDARHHAPLEFLARDVDEKESGVTVCYAIPDVVYVDGKPVAFDQYGRQEDVLKHEPADQAANLVGELEEELGVAAPQASPVKSDARVRVTGGDGSKAQVQLKLADGEHVLDPGALTFRVANGLIDPPPDGFVRVTPSVWQVPCVPLEVNWWPPPDRKGTAVIIRSGDRRVLHRDCIGSPLVLRVYLPPSAAGYTFELSDVGSFRVGVAANGATLLGEPDLAAGRRVAIDGLTIGILSPPAARAPAAPAPSADTAELYLFNDRNRVVYLEGERVQISVRAYGPAAQPGTTTLRLASESGDARDLGLLALRPAGVGAAAAEAELDTAWLRPGSYTLTATAGGNESNPLPLFIAPALPRTNMKLFGHAKWSGGRYEPAALKALVDNGFNEITHGPADTHGLTVCTPDASALEGFMTRVRPVDAERYKPWQKPRFPPELLEQPLEHQAGAEYLLRHGIGLRPHLGVRLILYFNVGEHWRDHAENVYQSTRHLAMEWRRFPNFAGTVYCAGDGMTPATMGFVHAAPGVANNDILHDRRLARLREVFQRQVGTIEVDDSATRAELDRIARQMQGAWGFGLGIESRDRLIGEDETKVAWLTWINALYPDAFRNHRAALQGPAPGTPLTAGSTWGFGEGSGMHAPLLYHDSDWVNNDNHGDYGTLPFHNITESDYIAMAVDRPRRRTREVIDLTGDCWTACGYKLFLQALSRNPVGIGVYTAERQIIGPWAQRKDRMDALGTLADLGARFGDVFAELDRQDEIAVLSSLRQAATGGQSYTLLQGAHYLAQKAGYQAAMITDDYAVQAGGAELARRYRGIFLVNMNRPLTPELKAVLDAFRRAGGVLMGDAASKPAMPDGIVVPIAALQGRNVQDHWADEQHFAPLIATFQAQVRPRLPSFFTTPASKFNVIRSVDADLEYWTAFNDGKDEAIGAVKGAVHYQYTYQGDQAVIIAAKSGTLYDAFRRTAIATRPQDGGIAFDSDMRLFPGTVYVLADRPIAALKLHYPGQVPRGALLTVTAEALDAEGTPFAGHLPVEILVTDPGGAERYRLYRRTRDALQLKIAGNDPAGAWRIAATDQVTGLSVSGTFTVAGEETPPALRPIDTVVTDAQPVHDLLTGTAEPVEVVLFPNQLASAETLALKLVADLKARDVEASVRIIWPSQLRNYPMQWFYETIEDLEPHEAVLAAERIGRRVQGKNHLGSYLTGEKGEYAFYSNYTGSSRYVFRRNVILLGGGPAGSNPLLDAIVDWRMLLRNPSQSFPAPGQGFIGYAWSPFHYAHDAIVLYGQDEAGLQASADRLVALAGGERPPADYRPRPERLGREDGRIYLDMGLKPATALAAVTGTERQAVSLLPPSHPIRVADALVDAAGRLLIAQEDQANRSGPNLAALDPAWEKVTQYRIETDLPGLARRLAGQVPADVVPNRLLHHLPQGQLAAVDEMLGLFDAEGQALWTYHPAPTARTYAEAKYPRTCKALAMSEDGHWVLASFHDNFPLHHGGSTQNRGEIVWLNTATGQPASRLPGYLASRLALSPDGSRALVLDDVCYGPPSGYWLVMSRPFFNPHGRYVLSVFNRDGTERAWFPVDHGATDRLKTDRELTLGIQSFADARRHVHVLDLQNGAVAQVDHPRADVGVAVSPNGAFGLVAYSDGVLRRLDRAGRIEWETQLPAPGVPAVRGDGLIAVAGFDGRVRWVDAQGRITRAVGFTDAPVEKPALRPDAPRPGLTESLRPWWETLPEDVGVAPRAGAPFAATTTLAGEQSVSIDVPPMDKTDVLLLALDYTLPDPGDQLDVELRINRVVRRLYYPYRAQPQRIGIPLRPERPGPVTLVFRGPAGATLNRGQLLHVKLGGFINAAYSPVGIGEMVALAPAPRVLVYNVLGLHGDAREEQLVYGWTATALPGLPPDITPGTVTNPRSYLDGDVYGGTPLYPTVYPGNFSWVSAQPNLRSAQLVLDYAKPRTITGIGIWEHGNQLPGSAWTLEACDSYTQQSDLTRELKGNWRLVAAGRGNIDYFHAHTFAPHAGKAWRFTIVSTPAAVQRIAELELYQDLLDNAEYDLGGL